MEVGHLDRILSCISRGLFKSLYLLDLEQGTTVAAMLAE